MRRVALVVTPDADDVRRVIVYGPDDGGWFLFLSKTVEDEGCFADEWYESLADVSAACRQRYGIEESMWRDVPDPEPGCMQDRIAAVPIASS